MSKLKKMRQARGLSQSKLAEKAGTNVRVLQHYEQQTKNFDHAKLETILKYAIALECKVEDIIECPQYVELIKKYKECQGI